jgi:AcrR family transcriptional regulator
VTKPPAQADKDDLRDRVLRASVDLIDEKGLGALSMREVARRAGVSHQAPYHYFPDREAILAAVAERGFDLLNQALSKAEQKATQAAHRIELSAIAYLTFATENPSYFRIMFRPELVTLSKHQDLDCAANLAFAHVPDMVAACIQAGLPKDIGAESMTAFLWSMVHGHACLIVDGLMVKVFPSFAQDRNKAIADFARTARRLVEAAIAETRRKSRKK